MPIPAIIAAVGTIVSGIGQGNAAQAQRRAERENAVMLEDQAREKRLQSEREARAFQDESEVVFGDTVSSFAKAGVDIGSGSAAGVLAEQRRKVEADTNAIRINGAQAAGITAREAAARRSNARAISRAAPLQVAGTLLSGAARTADLASKAED